MLAAMRFFICIIWQLSAAHMCMVSFLPHATDMKFKSCLPWRTELHDSWSRLICSFPDLCLVTWLSHDYHMIITSLSHDYHMTADHLIITRQFFMCLICSFKHCTIFSNPPSCLAIHQSHLARQIQSSFLTYIEPRARGGDFSQASQMLSKWRNVQEARQQVIQWIASLQHGAWTKQLKNMLWHFLWSFHWKEILSAQASLWLERTIYGRDNIARGEVTYSPQYFPGKVNFNERCSLLLVISL